MYEDSCDFLGVVCGVAAEDDSSREYEMDVTCMWIHDVLVDLYVDSCAFID